MVSIVEDDESTTPVRAGDRYQSTMGARPRRAHRRRRAHRHWTATQGRSRVDDEVSRTVDGLDEQGMADSDPPRRPTGAAQPPANDRGILDVGGGEEARGRVLHEQALGRGDRRPRRPLRPREPPWLHDDTEHRARSRRGHPQARHERPVVATPLLVSVVDDDESVRESLPDLLCELGFATETFASAEEFLASEHVGRTRCLVLDVAMPGMSGPELQAELARRGRAIPIVFITGQPDESVRPRVLAAGGVACLFKPFSDTALLDAVNAALGVGS